MGLLTDPGVEKSAIPAFLNRFHRIIALLFYIFGLLWFIGLAHNSLNHGTYFSENALLPGLVQGEFDGDAEAHKYLRAIREEAELHPNGVPYAWLLAQFTQIGLDTHSHNFTLHYPMGKKVFTGKNVYGILRAVRGSSTESLVVSAPYRPPTSVHQGTTASIALMLALAKFFSEQVYWAKDIIFLVTEHEQLGAQAWLEAYHRSSCGSGVLKAGDLPARAGPIQAAVNLEISSGTVSHLDVKIEGLNGQLPNLDLVNLIHRLCHRENVYHTFKNRKDPIYPETLKGWSYQLQTLLSMVATQAAGVPNGNHGLFHRFGIASVTVEGVRDSVSRGFGGRRHSATLLQMGRVLEGICRSLNNLLERFHQSFFFYLLPATNRYISIGVYMLPFGLLGGSIFAIAWSLWYSTSCEASEDKEKGSQQKDLSLLGAAPVVVSAHALGLLCGRCPEPSAAFGVAFNLPSEESVPLGILSFAVALMALPYFIKKSIDLRSRSWEVLKCVVALELSVIAFAGAVYNFSLALLLTVTYAPVLMLAAPSTSRLKKFARCLLVLCVHPLSLMCWTVLLDTILAFPSSDILMILKRFWGASNRALMYAAVDAHVYGNWLLALSCACALPIWLSLWVIVWYPTDKKHEKVKVN